MLQASSVNIKAHIPQNSHWLDPRSMLYLNYDACTFGSRELPSCQQLACRARA